MAGKKENRLCTITRQVLETKLQDERVGHYISSAWHRWSRSMISSTEGKAHGWSVTSSLQSGCGRGGETRGGLPVPRVIAVDSISCAHRYHHRRMGEMRAN